MTRIFNPLGRSKIFSMRHSNGNSIVNVALIFYSQVLEELLLKLQIEHVTWSCDKKGNYYHVIFPLQSGDPCETTLHCLTELKIGINFGSSVRYLKINHVQNI